LAEEAENSESRTTTKKMLPEGPSAVGAVDSTPAKPSDVTTPAAIRTHDRAAAAADKTNSRERATENHLRGLIVKERTAAADADSDGNNNNNNNQNRIRSDRD
jgi:hypothetical protein